ncbi:hypothetical protein [Microbulbifer elongatus]|uniref:Uncharacterized protein n=1 Tax=Microbulbifer elongatus TaxID=86173 RepID=A0ABT1NZL8_9GAMM|nr:hypothetical protein [Microbulbifer elongatus]MCQ3828226.1 hypothetical protein [Microbulbifer elongatus]
MLKQRHCATALLRQQRTHALVQARRVPLPAAMLGAFAGGFVLQRFFNRPTAHSLVNWYLTLRAI